MPEQISKGDPMNKRYIILTILSGIFVAVLAVGAAVRSEELFEFSRLGGLGDDVPAQLLVKFRSEEGRLRAFVALERGFALRAEARAMRTMSVHRMGVPRGFDAALLVRVMERLPDVEYAEVDAPVYALFTPNDPYYAPHQWNMAQVGMEKAWDVSQGEGVVVAVVDTGIAYENYGAKFKIAPDLAGTAFVPGYDFVSEDTHPNDENGHGTHVAGTIAQTTNNSLGVAGIAFKAKLMPIRVLNKYGSGNTSDVADGIRWAADNGAKVINLSLGSSSSSTTLKNALAYAYGKGVVIVAAAGNDGKNMISYPAAYDNYVIAVGATRHDKARVSYSNYGTSLDLVAPGGDLNVDQNGDGYGDGILQQTIKQKGRTSDPKTFAYYFFQGTSMATPHAAGVAALLISQGTYATPSAVQSRLETTADDLGTAGKDIYYGWGLVDADEALGL